MSLATQDIFKAIRKQYDDSSSLKNLTADEDALHDTMVEPKNAPLPRIVATVLGGNPHNSFSQGDDNLEIVQVQFQVHDDSESGETCRDIMDELDSEYGQEAAAMTFSGGSYTHVQTIREITPFFEHDRELHVWSGTVTYLFYLQRTT